MVTLGPYELLERIGAGGMAEVYLARRRDQPERLVALKRILPQFARDPRFVEMFCDEARICTALSHPNIVRVLDFGEDRGEAFMAMEYVPGVSVAKLLRLVAGRDKTFPVPIAIAVAQRVLRALCYAHDARDPKGRPLGVVHRDVSPGNILVSRSGEVKLTDFGIVRSDFVARRTYPGELKGKMGYMAPEQVVGAEVDRRTDLFTLGIVLAEMLIARPLFSGPSEMEILTRIYETDLSALERYGTNLPRPLLTVLMKALARDPNERYSDARQFETVLQSVAHETSAETGEEQVATWLGGLGLAIASSGVRLATPQPGTPRPAVGPSASETLREALAPTLPPTSPRKPVSSLPESSRFFLHRPGATPMPLSLGALVEGVATGRLRGSELVSVQGEGPRRVSQIPAVGRLLESSAYRFGELRAEQCEWQEPLRRRALPSLLFRTFAAGATGLVVVAHGNHEKRLYFVEGLLRFASSTSREELLGERLVQAGLITREVLADALGRASERGASGLRQFGTVLVEQGLVSRAELERQLLRQLRARVASLGTWSQGTVAWVPGETTDQAAPFGLGPDVVTEMVRRHHGDDEIRAWMQGYDHEAIVARMPPPFSLNVLGLSAPEQSVLEAVEGVVTPVRLRARLETRGVSLAQVRLALFVGLSSGWLHCAAWR